MATLRTAALNLLRLGDFSRSAPACRKVNALIRKAENLGAQKDQRYGKRKLGSELPDELQRRHDRPVRIRQSRKEIETG